MTLDDLRKMDATNLTPAQAAAVLGVNPHSIRIQAQNDPGKLGFPVIVVQSRTLIPRLPFIQFLTQLPKKEGTA